MSKVETLSVDLLVINGDTQSRVDVNSETVDEYAELISASKGKWPFGPLTVYHSGSVYYVADGFHRTLAAVKAGRASIPCDVKKGTARDARFFGMKANDEHGLRMSRDDRRKNVIWMLENYPEMTQANIAENAGVGVRTVERIVAERKSPENPPMAGFASKTLGKSSEQKTDEKYMDDLRAAETESLESLPENEWEPGVTEVDLSNVPEPVVSNAPEKPERSRNDQAKLNRQLAQALIDKAVRAVDDLHAVKRNEKNRSAAVKALQQAGALLW